MASFCLFVCLFVVVCLLLLLVFLGVVFFGFFLCGVIPNLSRRSYKGYQRQLVLTQIPSEEVKKTFLIDAEGQGTEENKRPMGNTDHVYQEQLP